MLRIYTRSDAECLALGLIQMHFIMLKGIFMKDTFLVSAVNVNEDRIPVVLARSMDDVHRMMEYLEEQFDMN